MSAPYEAPLLAGCSRCPRTMVLFLRIDGKPVCSFCWKKAGCPWPKN